MSLYLMARGVLVARYCGVCRVSLCDGPGCIRGDRRTGRAVTGVTSKVLARLYLMSPTSFRDHSGVLRDRYVLRTKMWCVLDITRYEFSSLLSARPESLTDGWPLTLKFDRAILSFLKIAMRHVEKYK